MKTIRLHRDAPAKPAVGVACNGCGICCSIAPCPLSRWLLGHRDGPCPSLIWRGGRYACGLLVEPTGFARWLPRFLVRRWIAAGIGCDCDAEIESSAG